MDLAYYVPLSCTISWSFLKLISIDLVMSSKHLILCHPLLLLSSISGKVLLSQHNVFSNELALQFKWPKYWSLSFIISPSKEYSELISFRIDWFDLLVLQVTLKGLLQHCNSKAPILWFSAFFMVQLSHTYMATGNTKGLIIWTFVSKVMSFLSHMLSRLS